MQRIFFLGLLGVLMACSNKQTTQTIKEVVPELQLTEVYFQELIPGQEGQKAYLVLAVVPEPSESKLITSAEVLDDVISLKNHDTRYTGLCPEIYSFSKGQVPQVKLTYIWKDSAYTNLVEAELKEALYMP